jgi:hypothetical protein
MTGSSAAAKPGEITVPNSNGKTTEISWTPGAQSQDASARIALTDIPFSNPLASSAVVLIGTGHAPEENPISVGLTLRQIKKTVQDTYQYLSSAMVTLYGFGPAEGDKPEAYESVAAGKGQRAHVPGLSATASFTRGNLLGALKSLKDHHTTHALLVFAGHGSTSGVATWQPDGQAFEPMIGPLALKQFIDASEIGQTVIVSGNCYGGSFAASASCGFFAARPDRSAAGCSPNATERQSPAEAGHYLAIFFQGIAGGYTTFADAHWNAVLKTAPTDSPFSSIDALADFYFASHSDQMPLALSHDEILALRMHGRPPEQRAYDLLLSHWLTTDKTVTRLNLLELMRNSDAKVLPLVRRLIFRRLVAKGLAPSNFRDQLRRLDACEGQNLAEFLKAKSLAERAPANRDMNRE